MSNVTENFLKNTNKRAGEQRKELRITTEIIELYQIPNQSREVKKKCRKNRNPTHNQKRTENKAN